jgi:UDP-3-O-[3-hydroxymyristoyl] glucosamine N-acyltransferase
MDQERVKTDNLVQIGHNVVVGEDTIIVAQAAIAGALHRKKSFWGQVAISDHVHIHDRAMVGSQSGLPRTSRLEKSSRARRLCLTVCGFEPVVFFPASPVSLNAFGLLRKK